MRRIPIAGPSITDKEVAHVAGAATDGWYENAGTYEKRFEERFADYVSREFALSLPSCTSALHLSLVALGVGPGDEVVLPDATWIASAAPVSYVGATPVFADIDPSTWCVTADSLRAVLTGRTRAVIPVDLYGGMPEMNALEEIAAERGIAMIEDAAEAVGSEYEGRRAGGFGTTSVFSFHGSKTLTTGEGGMVLTNDADLFRRMSFLRDHGRTPGDTTFRNREIAFKYKMSALQAALGLAQLDRVDELVERKRRIFSWYRERLEDVPGIRLNAEADRVRNSYWMVTVVMDPALGVTKEQLGAALQERGIDSRPFFHPLSSLPAYAGAPDAERAATENVVSYRICPYGLNLPSALRLTEADVDEVCRAVREILAVAS